MKEINYACFVEDYGMLLLADSENFYNFKIDDQAAAIKKAPKEEEEPKEKVKEKDVKDIPILKRNNLIGSIKKTADHNVKAIFTID